LEEKPQLKILIEREFAEVGDLAQAIALINASDGIQRSRDLAKSYAKQAIASIEWLPNSAHKHALLDLVPYILNRLY